MLRKYLRVKSSREIDKIFREGQTAKGDFLICKYLLSNLTHNRATFTVSKKLKLNAVKRNRVKRQLSHAFKQAKTSSENNSFDLVFILSRLPQNQKRFEAYQKDIQNILDKISNV
jgi:ribonuclease P protein component